jgi:hypothetical protein
LKRRCAAERDTEVNGREIDCRAGEEAEIVDEQTEGSKVGREKADVKEIYNDWFGFVKRDKP